MTLSETSVNTGLTFLLKGVKTILEQDNLV